MGERLERRGRRCARPGSRARRAGPVEHLHAVASAAKRNVPADHHRRRPVTQPRDSAG